MKRSWYLLTENIKVLKRDNNIVDWEPYKIYFAIDRAFRATYDNKEMKVVGSIFDNVCENILNIETDYITVEEIQDFVVDEIIDFDYKDVALKYIEHKANKTVERVTSDGLDRQIQKLAERDESIVNENANKDSRVFNTLRDLTSGVVAKHVGLKMFPEHVAKAHLDGDIHLHDLDYFPHMPYTNCCLLDVGTMLKDGVLIGNVKVKQPKSITVAASLIVQMLGSAASSQFGGLSIHEIDKVLEVYAEKSYDKHLKDAHTYSIPDKDKYSLEKTIKEIQDAIQALEYEINTLTSSSGQTPFVTFSFGRARSVLGVEIQKAILSTRLGGLSDGSTAIFPKLVYFLEDGWNLKPNDPSYDVKQLAVECSTKRLYPDVVSVKRIKELTGSVVTPMGCVQGDELVTWRDKRTGVVKTESIKRMYRRFENAEQLQPNGKDLYIDLEDVEIKDSHTGKVEYVGCKRMVKNSGNNWLRLTLAGGRVITCTDNHPLPVKGKGRVYAEDLEIGDVLHKSVEGLAKNKPNSTKKELFDAWLSGVIICDGCLHEGSEIVISYALTGEEEIANKIKSVYGKDSIREITHNRGIKGNYKEIVIKDKELRNNLVSNFGGIKKLDREIPAYIFESNRDTQLAFLGGMIDADGYINKRKNVIQIGSTNKSLAMGQMLLLEKLGIPAKVYLNYYKKGTSDVRYRVEAKANLDILSNIVCAKKVNNFNKEKRTNKVKTLETKVNKIEYIDLDEPSYDVTTESDFFDVSGIVSHNCRSFLPKWVNPDTGKEELEGRMNIGVQTLNLPRIGMESGGDIDKFWELFDSKSELIKEAILYRIKRVKEAKPENAPILYMQGGFKHKLQEGESVWPLFNRKRSTISFGYIGMYEAVSAVYGLDWENNPDAKEFSLEIMKRMKQKVDLWTKETDVWVSVYSTPSESLTDRFSNLDTYKFGKVEGITDKEYYTNSFHFDVYKKPTPFEKLDFEKDYPQFTSGGFIH